MRRWRRAASVSAKRSVSVGPVVSHRPSQTQAPTNHDEPKPSTGENAGDGTTNIDTSDSTSRARDIQSGQRLDTMATGACPTSCHGNSAPVKESHASGLLIMTNRNVFKNRNRRRLLIPFFCWSPCLRLPVKRTEPFRW
jgi:hypothetical protein